MHLAVNQPSRDRPRPTPGGRLLCPSHAPGGIMACFVVRACRQGLTLRVLRGCLSALTSFKMGEMTGYKNHDGRISCNGEVQGRPLAKQFGNLSPCFAQQLAFACTVQVPAPAVEFSSLPFLPRKSDLVRLPWTLKQETTPTSRPSERIAAISEAIRGRPSVHPEAPYCLPRPCLPRLSPRLSTRPLQPTTPP